MKELLIFGLIVLGTILIGYLIMCLIVEIIIWEPTKKSYKKKGRKNDNN